MRRKNSARSLVLQPPAGFRPSRVDGVIILSDGASMCPNSEGLYHLDHAHVHLLPNFVAQGWHAPRPEVAMSEWGRAQTLNVIEILNLANSERVALKVEKGRLLMRGAPSARLWAHLRDARVALCDEITRQEGIAWVEV
jgi:hypothetical protein